MKFVPASVTRKIAMTALSARSSSPTILFGAGVVGVVSTVVLASRATLKLEEVLEETNQKLVDVRSLEHSSYSEQDRQKDKAILYTDAVMKIARLYGPAIVVGTISIGCLAGSHRILTRRNAALGAAYAAVEKGFKEYRERVVEELGEEKDKEFLHGTRTVTVKDEKTGKKTKKKVLGDGKNIGPYAVIYDELNPHWQDFPDHNKTFLDIQQRWANERLRAHGFLFLNDLYEALGFPRTAAGQIVGWWWDGDGDNYVDFGIGDWPSMADYLEGREVGVILDFNVDGPIYKNLR